MKKKKKTTEKFQSTEIKKTTYNNPDYKMAITFVVVLIIILAVLALVYFLNGKYVTKDKFQTTTTTTSAVEFDDTQIIVDHIFSVKEDNYYVLCYDKKDENSAFLYSGFVNVYRKSVPLYTIDMSNAMNKGHYDKNGKENKNPSKSSEVVITRPTLIEIKDGKVVSYITDRDKIAEKLSNKD